MSEILTHDSKEAALGSFESPLSVGDLTEKIKDKLESDFQDVVVVGEISNFKPHPSGHHYFSLKDERATISAVMFRQSNARLKFQPDTGLRVVAVGRISVYPPRGNYQILITRMEPEGLGALQLAFEQLKKKLEAKGYFSQERKRPLPKFPVSIGIITAPAGAAIRDMLNVLDRRFAGLHILIYPVKVQGEGSALEISQALRHLNKFFPELDVIICGRGGGSLEDLWAFNEEPVANAIFESKIPVISAVGHEVDFTIADFVADLRAPTPSAAAELVVGSKLEILRHLDHLVRRLQQMTRRLELEQMRVDELVQRLIRVLESRLSDITLRLERSHSALLRNSPLARMNQYVVRYKHLCSQFDRIPKQIFERRYWALEKLNERLRLLNPKAIMERGYSIVRNMRTQKVIRMASEVRMGDQILVELHKGKIRAKV